MNQQIIIQSIEVCDANRDVLPMSSDVAGAFVAIFTPSPTGSTGSIFLKVTCQLLPDGQGQVLYRLVLINHADFEFALGSGTEVKYIRQASDDMAVFLPLEVKNITPLESALPLQMRLFVRDTDPNPPNTASKFVTIIGKN